MTALHLAAALAVMAAAGHSILSERLFLRRLRREAPGTGVLTDRVGKRLVVAMFHMASLCWVTLALSTLWLEPGGDGYGRVLHLYAGVYVISGLGNFWAVGRPHPGGVLLLSAGALILVAQHT